MNWGQNNKVMVGKETVMRWLHDCLSCRSICDPMTLNVVGNYKY